MNKGRLNKTELNRLVRAYRDLDAMFKALPHYTKLTKGSTEESTYELITRARQPISELLSWQSHNDAWQRALQPADTTTSTES